ncbi:MAG: ASCH domain protein [Firmicutes bacterium ADurb.Bin182]|nr:MAG: ASCH domain protein [Firmicutes bacterium ADurb.Bin182]
MFSIERWMEQYLEAVRLVFGKRIMFAGLQGSYARGEATEKSDIDVVLILDTLNEHDLALYRDAIADLPEREKICGFISGKKELYRWEKAELLQFCQDTTCYVGSLRPLLLSLSAADVRRAILDGACAVYHGVCHNLLNDRSREQLKSLYKTAFLTIQAQHYERKKIFIRQRSELLPLLTGLEKEIGMNVEKSRVGSISDADFDALSNALLHWSGAVLRGERTDKKMQKNEPARFPTALFSPTQTVETATEPQKPPRGKSARRADGFLKIFLVILCAAVVHSVFNAVFAAVQPYRGVSAWQNLFMTLLCYAPFLLISGGFYLHFFLKAKNVARRHMTPDALFLQYQKKHPEAQTFEAWAFCGGGPLADELLQLVLDGKKRATTSPKEAYDYEGEALPEPGSLSVVLDSKGFAQCIIETTIVEVYPFSLVPESFARTEGEGDGSLAYWREVHTRAITAELSEIGLTFSEDTPVVLETFRLVFRADGKPLPKCNE